MKFKRLICMGLLGACLLTGTACGASHKQSDKMAETNVKNNVDKNAVEKTESLIDKIGKNITPESEGLITKADAAYKKLNKSEKKLVSNKTALDYAKKKLSDLKEDDSASQIKAFTDLLAVAESDPSKIKEARDTYNALPDSVKMQIKDIDKLQELEAAQKGSGQTTQTQTQTDTKQTASSSSSSKSSSSAKKSNKGSTPSNNASQENSVPEAAPAPTAPSLPDAGQAKSEIMARVNSERAAAGLAPLTEDGTLDSVAATRARDLVTLYEHQRPDGTDFTSLLPAGYSFTSGGENIAVQRSSGNAVMDSWMASPGHKANILDPSFTKIGIGVYVDANTAYQTHYCQVFTN